jgi:hypothetical protein
MLWLKRLFRRRPPVRSQGVNPYARTTTWDEDEGYRETANRADAARRAENARAIDLLLGGWLARLARRGRWLR